MPKEENYETYCEYLCIRYKLKNLGIQVTNMAITHYVDQTYWFHEDESVDYHYFLPVVDAEGFPVTKRVRVG